MNSSAELPDDPGAFINRNTQPKFLVGRSHFGLRAIPQKDAHLPLRAGRSALFGRGAHQHQPSRTLPRGRLRRVSWTASPLGVGVVIATQNPMDLDHRALSNAGLWCIGRLQTDADRERVIEGLSTAGAASDGPSAAELSDITKRLAPRWFVLRDVHSNRGTVLMQPRWAMSFLRGPMTATEIRKARGGVERIPR